MSAFPTKLWTVVLLCSSVLILYCGRQIDGTQTSATCHTLTLTDGHLFAVRLNSLHGTTIRITQLWVSEAPSEFFLSYTENSQGRLTQDSKEHKLIIKRDLRSEGRTNANAHGEYLDCEQYTDTGLFIIFSQPFAQGKKTQLCFQAQP